MTTHSTLISDYVGVGLLAARPVTPNITGTAQALYYATDTAMEYAWNGAAWVTIGGTGSAGTIVAGTGLGGGTIVGSGTLTLGTIAAHELLGNYGTAAAIPVGVTIGSGLTLNATGTLAATVGGGSVTSVVAGTGLTGGTITTSGTIALDTASANTWSANQIFTAGVEIGSPTGGVLGAGTLNAVGLYVNGVAVGTGSGSVSSVATGTGITGGPITTTGTVSLANRTASSLMGNPGTAAAVPSDIAIGSGLSLSIGGTLSATPTGNLGAVVNAGVVQINNVITLAGTAAGTLTIGPGTGTSDVIVNMPASGGTVTLSAAPAFTRQRVEVDIKQGATAGSVTLNSGFVFGTSGPTSYTATATAAAIDRLMLLSPDGTKYAVMAINQGFTV